MHLTVVFQLKLPNYQLELELVHQIHSFVISTNYIINITKTQITDITRDNAQSQTHSVSFGQRDGTFCLRTSLTANVLASNLAVCDSQVAISRCRECHPGSHVL